MDLVSIELGRNRLEFINPGLLLGAKAPVMMPDGAKFTFLFFLLVYHYHF